MKKIHLRSRAAEDGTLTLDLETGLPNATLDVTVLLEPAEATDEAAWHEFVKATAGSIPDPTFTRHDEGDFEVRDSLP